MRGKYRLYGGGVSRSIAVEMVLRELELPYEMVAVDIAAGAHRGDEFLKVNPAGYVPALLTPSGEVLHENAGIMLWLADAHGDGTLAPAAHDPLRGLFLSKLFYHTNEIQPAMKRYFYAERYTPDAGAVAGVRARAREMALERWETLDRYLADHGPHHLGDRYSLLDSHMAMWAAYGLDDLDEVLGRFNAVRACFERAAQRRKSGALLLALRDDFRRLKEARQAGT